MKQLALFETDRPPGLRYTPDALTAAECAALVDRLRGLPLHPFVMRGVASKRLVSHFGFDYVYAGGGVKPGPAYPPWLAALRDRAADWAGVPRDVLVEALITRYPPGAGIGWHVDAPAFDEPIVGLSLGSSCRMRFRNQRTGEKSALELEPGSLYALTGPARFPWQHSIPTTAAERFSITFRPLKSQRRRAAETS